MAVTMFDTHVHSYFSCDGKESLDNIYNTAKALGLLNIAVTDHYDIDIMSTGIDERTLSPGFSEIAKMREQTIDKNTRLLCGIELGASVFDTQAALQILENHNYDIVIGSLHGIAGKPQYYMLDFANMSPDEIVATLTEYFETQLKQVQLGLFDTLAHLDYPTRYIRRLHIGCSLAPYYDIIDEILKTLAKGGKALEINTSGLYDCYKATLPQYDVIKRFRDLGGEYITVGSDAHIVSRIASGFDYTAALAKKAGFDYLTYYVNRKPISVKIEL